MFKGWQDNTKLLFFSLKDLKKIEGEKSIALSLKYMKKWISLKYHIFMIKHTCFQYF